MATAHGDKKEGKETASLTSWQGLSSGGDKLLALEIHIGEPRQCNDKEAKKKGGNKATAADGSLRCKKHRCQHRMSPNYHNTQRAFSLAE